MFSAKILVQIQFAVVALCFLALAAAIAALLLGSKRDTVFALGVAGTVLGAASLGIGVLVKRAQSMESNPYYALAQMVERARAMPPPNHLIQITIRPAAAGGTRYLVTLRNASKHILTDGSLDHSRLLHPGKYGLDDTHMPADIWIQPPVEFKSLAAGAEITFEVEGYAAPDRYDGPRQTTVSVSAAGAPGDTAPAAVGTVTASVNMAW